MSLPSRFPLPALLVCLTTLLAACGPASLPQDASSPGNESQAASKGSALASSCGHLLPGEALYQNEVLFSCNTRAKLGVQNDGNTVLYSFDNRPLWATATQGVASMFVMQGDGNLVLYDASMTPIWASNTSGYPGAYLALQDDGNMVIYSNGQALWATGTHTLLYQGLNPTLSPQQNCFNTKNNTYSELTFAYRYDGPTGYAVELVGAGDCTGYVKATVQNWGDGVTYTSRDAEVWLEIDGDPNIKAYTISTGTASYFNKLNSKMAFRTSRVRACAFMPFHRNLATCTGWR